MGFNEFSFSQPLRWGMVGGGLGSQIGHSHRSAASRDGLFKLCCGAFDINPEKGREFGQTLNLNAERCYKDYLELIEKEKLRPDPVQVLSIATPNSTHYQISKAALEAGLHVICEKPLTLNSQEALHLGQIADSKGLLLAVMYGYTGFGMVEHACNLVKQGQLGEIRVVNMQFAHGYHAQEVEKKDAGAKWRVTPEIAGRSYAVADLGTHCFQLGQLISNLKVQRLMCIRRSFVKSRAPLEDDAQVLIEYENGAIGNLWASAVNIGAAHGLKLRIIGGLSSLEWCVDHPNQLQFTKFNEATQTLERGAKYLAEHTDLSRVSCGHPEGYFESWANLYRRFAARIAKQEQALDVAGLWYPNAKEGLEGVRFIECCVESANQGGVWVDFA